MIREQRYDVIGGRSLRSLGRGSIMKFETDTVPVRDLDWRRTELMIHAPKASIPARLRSYCLDEHEVIRVVFAGFYLSKAIHLGPGLLCVWESMLTVAPVRC